MIYIIFLVLLLFTYIYLDIIVNDLFFGNLNILPSLLSVLAAFISSYVAWKTYSLNKKINDKEKSEKRTAKKTDYNNCVIILELKKSLVEDNIKAIKKQECHDLFKIESEDFEPIIFTTVKYLDKDKMPKIRDIIIMTKKMNKKIDRINKLQGDVEKINAKNFELQTSSNKELHLQKHMGLMGNAMNMGEIKDDLKKSYIHLENFMNNLKDNIEDIHKKFLEETDK